MYLLQSIISIKQSSILSMIDNINKNLTVVNRSTTIIQEHRYDLMQSPTFSNSSKIQLLNKLSPTFRNKRIPSAHDHYNNNQSSKTLAPWNHNQQQPPQRINSCKKLESPLPKQAEKKRKRSQNISHHQRRKHLPNIQNINPALVSSLQECHLQENLNSIASNDMNQINILMNNSKKISLAELTELKQQYKTIKDAYQQLITQTLKNKQLLQSYKEKNKQLQNQNVKSKQEIDILQNKLTFMEKQIERIKRQSYKLIQIQQFKSKKLYETLAEKESFIVDRIGCVHCCGKGDKNAKELKDGKEVHHEYASIGDYTIASTNENHIPPDTDPEASRVSDNHHINIEEQQSYTFHTKSKNNLAQAKKQKQWLQQQFQPSLSSAVNKTQLEHVNILNQTELYYPIPLKQQGQSLTFSNEPLHQNPATAINQRTISHNSQFISISLTSMMENQSQYRELSTKRNTKNNLKGVLHHINNNMEADDHTQDAVDQNRYNTYTSHDEDGDYEFIDNYSQIGQQNHEDAENDANGEQQQPSDIFITNNPNKNNNNNIKSKNRHKKNNQFQFHSPNARLPNLNPNDKNTRLVNNNSGNMKKFRKELCKKLQVNLDDKHRQLLLHSNNIGSNPHHNVLRTPLDRKTSKSHKSSKAKLNPNSKKQKNERKQDDEQHNQCYLDGNKSISNKKKQSNK